MSENLSNDYPSGFIENSGIRSKTETYVFTGDVVKMREWTQTNVSGGGSSSGVVVGHTVMVNSAPITTTHHNRVEFWLQNPETGAEMTAQLDGDNIALREGHKVSLIYSRKGNDLKTLRAINYNMSTYYRIATKVGHYTSSTRTGKYFLWSFLLLAGFYVVGEHFRDMNFIALGLGLIVLFYLHLLFLRSEVNAQLDDLSSKLLNGQPLKTQSFGGKARGIYRVLAICLFLGSAAFVVDHQMNIQKQKEAKKNEDEASLKRIKANELSFLESHLVYNNYNNFEFSGRIENKSSRYDLSRVDLMLTVKDCVGGTCTKIANGYAVLRPQFFGIGRKIGQFKAIVSPTGDFGQFLVYRLKIKGKLAWDYEIVKIVGEEAGK